MAQADHQVRALAKLVGRDRDRGAVQPADLPLHAQDKTFLVLNANGHTKRIRAVFFTPKGKELISVAEDKTIRVWSVSDGTTRHILRLPLGREDRGTDLGMSAALSADGKTLAVGTAAPVPGRQHWIYFVDLASEKVERVLKLPKGAPWGLALSPDGKLLAHLVEMEKKMPTKLSPEDEKAIQELLKKK